MLLVRSLLLIMACVAAVKAVVLDGTVTPTIINVNYHFSDGDAARGAVYFRKGFSLSAGTTVTLDRLLWPIDGPINLNGTGQISLMEGTVLRLGPNFEGFTNGGIITAPSTNYTKIFLDTDTTVSGQLELRNQTDIHLNGHTLTLADAFTARGSVLANYSTAFAPVTFIRGTIVNAHDFTTGYGPRFRGVSTNNTYVFEASDLILGSDRTMTLTTATLTFGAGESHVRTQSRATLRIQSYLLLDTTSTMFLDPGITLFLDNANSGIVGFERRNNVTVGLNSATLKTAGKIGFVGYANAWHVRGSSVLQATASFPDPHYSLAASEVFNIAPGAQATLDAFYLSTGP